MEKELDIGAVVSTTFQVITSNLSTLVILSVIFVGVPSAVMMLLFQSNMNSVITNDGAISTGFFGGALLMGIVGAACSILLQASIIETTVSQLRGTQHSVQSAVSVATGKLLPLIAISIGFGIILMIGFMLLVIPGLIALTFFAVVVPVYVIEKQTIIGAFERSAKLTEGQRWRIFALIVIAWILALILGFVMGLIQAAIFGVGGGFSTGSLGLSWILDIMVSMASGIVSGVGVSVLYTHLRMMQDGESVEQIGSVFD